MKVMADTSAYCLGGSVGEAAESASPCESGPHLGCRAARCVVSDLRALGLRHAPVLGFGGRAPSKVEMGRRVLGHASRLRSLLSPSNPISESCCLLSIAVRCSFAMGQKQLSNPRVGFHPISSVVIGASGCISLNAVYT